LEDEPGRVIADDGVKAPLLFVGTGIDQKIVALRLAKPVQKEFLVVVGALVGRAGCGRGVTAVEKKTGSSLKSVLNRGAMLC